MTYVYLDWNVFDRIEKKDNLSEEQRDVFSKIEQLISDCKIICPYSNAHINDLIRGHSNNPNYIPKHLETLKRLTKNLCIVQYWGNTQTTWHYRDVAEFFNSALEDKEVTVKPFSKLMDWDETGLFNKRLDILRLTPIPSNFKEIYKANPIFNLMFPRTKTEMNMLALCEDLYDFSTNATKDYSLYKSLRIFINQSRVKLKNQRKMLKEIDKGISELPTYLNLDDAWEKYAPKNKTSDNPEFQKITDTYFKIDFRGYKSDEKFSNLIDDSLHVFYGAHCDYFVTIDDKCHYKAAETYHKLGIATIPMKPNEFINCLLKKN
jgi:hypothetical protein